MKRDELQIDPEKPNFAGFFVQALTYAINVCNSIRTMREKKSVLSFIGLGDLGGRSWRVQFSFWAIVLLSLILFSDQQLVAPNMSRIGADLGFPNKEDYQWQIGGKATLFFFVMGGAVAVGIGIAADIFSRKKLMVGCVLLGATACILTGLAPNYTWFLIFRTLTGIGLGGLFPVIFSLIGDFFRYENRASASGWIDLAMGLGMAIGQVGAAEMANVEGFGLPGWRLSFLVMAAPAIPLIILFYFFAEMPKRGESEQATRELSQDQREKLLDIEDHQPFKPKDVARVFSTKTNLVAFFQGMPGMVPWGFLFVYIVDFYEKSKGFQVSDAALLTIAFGGSSILGGFFQGQIGRFLYKKNRNLLPIYCAAMILLGAIPAFYIVNFSGTSLLFPMIAAGIAGLLVNAAGVNIRAILINTNLPENRGSVFAFFSFFDKLGAGFGPFAVALLLKFAAEVVAFNIAIAFWIPCAAIWILFLFTMAKDEDRVNRILKERAKAAQ